MQPAGAGEAGRSRIPVSPTRALKLSGSSPAARAVLSSLTAGLREAEVLELPAGASLRQRSSLVVLRGTLRAAGAAPALPTSAAEAPRAGGAAAAGEAAEPGPFPQSETRRAHACSRRLPQRCQI